MDHAQQAKFLWSVCGSIICIYGLFAYSAFLNWRHKKSSDKSANSSEHIEDCNLRKQK